MRILAVLTLLLGSFVSADLARAQASTLPPQEIPPPPEEIPPPPQDIPPAPRDIPPPPHPDAPSSAVQREEPRPIYERSSSPVGVRVAVQVPVGLAVGSLFGLGITFIELATPDAPSSLSSDAAVINATVRNLTLTPFTTMLAVLVVGDAFDATGRFGLTLVGALLGGLVGSALGASAFFAESEDLYWAGQVVTIVASTAGAVIGYEASNDALEPHEVREPALVVLPQVTPLGGGGATLGVVGIF